MKELLTGFAFPFRIVRGVRRTTGFEKIEENVRHLLSTSLSERVMLRGYGGGVRRHAEEPNDETLRTIIRYEIEQALRRYMPEVELTTPLRLAARGPELIVSIEYRADPTEVIRRLQIQLTP